MKLVGIFLLIAIATSAQASDVYSKFEEIEQMTGSAELRHDGHVAKEIPAQNKTSVSRETSLHIHDGTIQIAPSSSVPPVTINMETGN